jgi:hypothetical protein
MTRTKVFGKQTTTIHGYKGFLHDMTCRGFQYECGKTFYHTGEVELGASGFHFSEELKDVFTHYTPFCNWINPHIYCHVIGSGTVDVGGEKVSASILHVGKRLDGKHKLWQGEDAEYASFRNGRFVRVLPKNPHTKPTPTPKAKPKPKPKPKPKVKWELNKNHGTAAYMFFLVFYVWVLSFYFGG